MTTRHDIRLDAATGLSRGRRRYQEDAVMGGAASDGREGLVALADGCGGHARGDLASNIAVDVALRAFAREQGDVPARLRAAAAAANLAVYARGEGDPELEGMSTTLLLLRIEAARLHWASVGDSPLWLMRDGRLKRLNATHSLARQLDLLVEMGERTAEQAAGHPARSCLTSALGGCEIEELDCPDAAVDLAPGDVILAASDGLLSLSEITIAQLLREPDSEAGTMVDRLLHAVSTAGGDSQDNTSVAVLRVEAPRERSRQPSEREGGAPGLPGKAVAAVSAVFGAATQVTGLSGDRLQAPTRRRSASQGAVRRTGS